MSYSVSGQDYSKAALIIWDMQYAIARRAFNYEYIVPNIGKLIDGAILSSLPVIYSKHVFLPPEYMDPYMVYSLKRRGIDPASGVMSSQDQHEWQIINEIAPRKNDLVLEKYSSSFFVGTILNNVLRKKEVTILILTGVSTEGGIESTARQAATSGYLPLIVSDAVGSSDQGIHEAMLKVMRKVFEVRETQNVLDEFLRKKTDNS